MGMDMGARIAIMNTVLGQIPNGSITNNKLDPNGITATVSTLLQDIVALEGTGWTNQTIMANATALSNLKSTPTFTGTVIAPAVTTTGTITSAGLVTGQTMTVTGANDGIDIGALTTANTPYVDLHSSGNNIDYDVRIMATGGDTANGDGLLTIKASAGVTTSYLTATAGYKNLGFLYASHLAVTVNTGATTTVTHNLGYNPMIFFTGTEGAVSLNYSYVTANTFTVYNYGTTNWVGYVNLY